MSPEGSSEQAPVLLRVLQAECWVSFLVLVNQLALSADVTAERWLGRIYRHCGLLRKPELSKWDPLCFGTKYYSVRHGHIRTFLSLTICNHLSPPNVLTSPFTYVIFIDSVFDIHLISF